MIPVSPENKGVAKLFPSKSITRGELRRFMVENTPYIIAHVDDIAEIRAILIEKGYSNIDQIIADIGEELFARYDASREK